MVPLAPPPLPRAWAGLVGRGRGTRPRSVRQSGLVPFGRFLFSPHLLKAALVGRVGMVAILVFLFPSFSRAKQ